MKAIIKENSEQFPDLQVQFVYICTEHVSGNKELYSAKWELWVPDSQRAFEIRQAHDSIVNAKIVNVKIFIGQDYLKRCEITYVIVRSARKQITFSKTLR